MITTKLQQHNTKSTTVLCTIDLINLEMHDYDNLKVCDSVYNMYMYVYLTLTFHGDTSLLRGIRLARYLSCTSTL